MPTVDILNCLVDLAAVQVIISKTGSPVLVSPFDQKLRDLRTLKQHYYPEGGWGWVIAVTAVLVQVIAYGLQVGMAVFLIQNPGRTGMVRRAGREMMTIWLPRTGRTE